MIYNKMPMAENNTKNPDELIGVPTASTTEVSRVVETVVESPSITSEVSGPCKNPEGKLVGLSPVKREKLGVEVGDFVEVEGHGVFTVAPALVGNLGQNLVAVNGVTPGTKVTIRKVPEGADNAQKLAVEHGVEADEKHEKRRLKIASRFPAMDPDTYLCVPTSLAPALGLPATEVEGKRVYGIAVSIVNVGGVIHEIPLVPTGAKLGLTSQAAQKLNIPKELKDVEVRVKDGVLVI